MNQQVNIAIIDTHEIYRNGLKVVLAKLNVNIIGEGANTGDLFVDPSFKKADILLLDIGMQCVNCSRNLSNFLDENKKVAAIGMVQHYEQVRVNEMQEAGIKGFFTKNTGRKEIQEAIETVLLGKFYMPSEYKKLKTNKL